MAKSKLRSSAFVAVFRELRRGAGDPRPLTVAGARELVPILARELRAGGDASAVVEGETTDATAVVWVGAADEQALKRFDRAGIPIVAVSDATSLPYVLATNIVAVPPGQGFPVEEIASALARCLGEDGTALAAKLPVLRPAMCGELIRAFAKRNAMISAAVFIPGVDMPILTVNQMRLVARIAFAHGREMDGQRRAELLGVVGAGFGFRAVARGLLGFVPFAGWAVKGGVAYVGTKALGEAAVRYFETRS